MKTIQDILKERIDTYNSSPEKWMKVKSKEYNQKWNEAVGFFRIEINKDRKKAGLSELSFIGIRQKLLALKEIDDLRWFYFHCKKYSVTKDKNGVKNTFSKCFFGSLK